MQTLLRTICPQCRQLLRVAGHLRGQEATCPSCGSVFVIQEIGDDPSPSTRVRQASSDTVQAVQQDDVRTAPESDRACRLGRFRLSRLLGQGAFGRVYQAHDPQLDREVALKVPTFGSGDQGKVQRFFTEAKAAARLRHPNIVPVFECGRVDNCYYISSQYIRGTTLAERIKSETPDFRQVAQWVAAIAEGLAYAHEHGIVHRDVKPQNIMLDERGEPQVMDFGLAKRMDEDSSLTHDGSILGTPAYMAPEQARGENATIGPASDQYSLGVILYELLTGKRPFEGPSHSVIAQAATREPPTPRSVRPEIPRDLEAICLKAMQKEQAQRYGSLVVMGDDLRRWLDGAATIARPLGYVERLSNWRRRNPTIANLVLLVVCVTSTALITVSMALAKVAAQRQVAVEARRAAEAAQGLAERNAEQTRRERDRAETNLTEANRQRKEADEQRELAEQRLRQFEEEKRRGDTLQADSDLKQQLITGEQQRRVLAERQSTLGRYLNLINQAYLAIDAQPAVARHLLDECEPSCRAWEWSFLKSCSRGASRSISPTSRPTGELALTPTGDCVAVSLADGHVIVYGTVQSSGDQTSGGRPVPGTWALFGPSGTRMLAGGKGAGMTLWDVASGATAPTSFLCNDVITCAAMSPDEKVAVTASGSRDPFVQQDHNVRVWHATTGKVVHNLTGHPSPVCALALSADGQMIAAGTTGGEIRLWQTASGQLLASGQFRSAVRRIVFAPDNARFAVLTEGYEGVLIGSCRTGHSVDGLARKGTRILDVTFSEDGSHLAALDPQGQAFLWDTNSRELRKVLSVEEHDFSEEQPATGGRLLATPFGWLFCLTDGTNVYLERQARGVKGLELRGHQDAVRCLCSRTQSDLVASCGDDAAIWLWNPQTRQHRRLVERFDAVTTSITLLPDSPWLAVGQDNGTLVLLDVNTGSMLRQWTGHNGPIRSLACTGDGQVLASAGDDGFIRLWKAAEEPVVREIATAGVPVLAVDIHPDGTRLAAALADGTMCVWSLADAAAPPIVCAGHTGPVCAVHFHPSQNVVASAGEDAMVRIWDLRDGQARAVMRGHFGPVRGLRFSLSGDRLASASDDQTLRVWEPETGLEALRLIVSDRAVTSLAFLADGQSLAVAGADGVVRVFDASGEGATATEPSPGASVPTQRGTEESTTAEPKQP